jgi:acyl dehydratase
MSARWRGVQVRGVGAYRALCGSSAEVPVAWPQLVATALHVGLVTDPRFPLRPMGLVHPRFVLTQHRPPRVGERLDIEVGLGGRRDTDTGFEFDLTTRVMVGEECVWESTAATYVRLRAREGPAEPEPADSWDTQLPLSFPAGAGRAYARLSGDWNPVHVHPLTARLFGFRRPIAHGWYLLARSLAALGRDAPAGPTTVTFELRRPTFLPSALDLRTRRERKDGESPPLRFALTGADGKVRALGTISAPPAAAMPASP